MKILISAALRDKSASRLALAVVLFAACQGFWDRVEAQELKLSYRKATFAGGCFWGIEKVFSELDGVVSTQAGYTGGVTKDPVYEQVCSGRTGHAEAIEITYDPARVRYEDLLEVFFTHHDPTTLNRQGPDTGTQYRSAVFYHDLPQKEAVIKARDVLDRAGIFKTKIVTEIQPVGEFYPAEEYHQKYLQKNPHGYCSIQLQSPRIKQALKESGPGETHE